MNVLLLILGIVLFLGLVVIHEFGHFIMARRGGVDIEEFGIGFPPRLFAHRMRRGWLFTLNLLPLGGFVKLKGEHDVDMEPGSFGAASTAVKARIMVAGVVMNLIAAYVLLLLLAVVGMPQLVANQFTVKSDTTYVQRAISYVAADTIESGSPAAIAGIRPDDPIVAIGAVGQPKPLTATDELPHLTQQFAGQPVTIEFRQGSITGRLVTKTVTLRTLAQVQRAQAAGKPAGYLGVSVYSAQKGVTVVRATWSAPLVAVGVIWQFTVLTMQGLGHAVAGVGSIIAGLATGNTHARQAGQAEASSQVAGPIGIFFIFKYGSALGIRFMLLIVAVLSLTLAIMNILPIPALDGGRLWLMLATRAIRKPLTPEMEEMINAAGFAFIIGLVILISIVDVRRFF